jgi:hypothetical protein
MDETDRYRELLQKSLLTEGWEDVFDYHRLSAWVQQNQERLRASARATLGDIASGHEDHFADTVKTFSPRSKYDLPMTEAIFRPIFEGVAECAREIGLQPLREVELVTSTSINPTPFARPTTGTHQLFIGPGIIAFCSYWAKAYTATAQAIAAEAPNKQIISPEDLKAPLAKDPSGILLASRLCLYYAATGTLLGFGEVKQPPNYLPLRMELLMAMEVFALSHEYAHFLADERGLQLADESEEVSAEGLEHFCDAMGLQLSRFWGSKNDNLLAFSGAGGLAFFRVAKLADVDSQVLAHVHSRSRQDIGQDSHPPLSERALNLIKWATENTEADQKVLVESCLGQWDIICTTIRDYVSDILHEAAIAAKYDSLTDEPSATNRSS